MAHDLKNTIAMLGDVARLRPTQKDAPFDPKPLAEALKGALEEIDRRLTKLESQKVLGPGGPQSLGESGEN